MSVDARANLVLATPRDDRVDELVTATVGELLVLPSQRLQVIRIVGQPRDVGLHIRAGRRASLDRVGLEDYRLRRADPWLRSDGGARLRRMLRRNEIRMRTVGLCRRKLQHLRMERRDQDRDRLLGHRGPVKRALYLG